MKAVLDANVLFPFTLRDTLLRAAAEGCFQVYWSEQILEEATRNLVETEVMTGRQAERLRVLMEQAFPEAMVRGHERLIGSMRNHQKDRHVAAAERALDGADVARAHLRVARRGADRHAQRKAKAQGGS